MGNLIYPYVLKLIGEEKAPKVTGMLIDLPETELNLTISNWAHFEKKVFSAFKLIVPVGESAVPPEGA